MKSGDVSKILGIDRKTVTAWSKRFVTYLSSSGIPETQREYTHDDITVLFTVLTLRAGNTSWEDIGKRLESGERYLPPEEFALELAKKESRPNESALTTSERMLAARRISDLEIALEEARQQIRAEIEDKDRLRNTMYDEIRRLEREIGKLMAIIEMSQNPK